MINLNTPIEELPKVGPVYQKKLKKMGIKNVRELLFHFPHRYEDFSKIIPISKVKLNEIICAQGKILEIKNSKTWKKRMILTKAIIEDETAAIKAIWFNQPYLTKNLKAGDFVCFCGKATLGAPSKNDRPEIYLANPAYEKIRNSELEIRNSDLTHTGRIIPVYPETEGLSSRWLRYILKPLLLKFKDKIPEPLPEKIRAKHNLLPTNQAIWQIHFPDSLKMADLARSRFIFENLFLLELSVLKEKIKLKRAKAIQIPINIDLMKKFTESLPFELTDSQKKSAWQILKDLEKPYPMSRLLQGDVGSGKTVVAAMAALNAAKAGYQTAVMAPTEILAKQHFKEIPKLIDKFGIKIALLTGKETSEKSRKELMEKLEQGWISILIGTHALIQEGIKFKNLALVVIDEQHRFGVNQRQALVTGPNIFIPHLLSMTATPIPRTLALTVYGDLDLSLITEMPKNRKMVKTAVISPNQRQKAYDFIREEVKKGQAVFVICPRIEKSTNSELNTNKRINEYWAEVKAVKEEYEKLAKEIFPDLKIGCLHGKIKTKEKEKIMAGFKEGEIDILVSTSVVEVGIDIPRATVMMIEGAERFGLSQLHQFRGRVGRGSFQSYCFLFSDFLGKNQRLSALVKTNNGLELAERDLKIRGPGELYGKKQWGIPDLAMANLGDLSLVEKTREAAKEILQTDPELKKHPLLKTKLEEFEKEIHFE